jgi:tetratricopeptide (TPR) repeat protein
MHFREQGDHDQAAKHLDLAIEHDKPQLHPTPTPIWDIDVLIGLHRLPDPPEDRRRTTEQMIEQTGATYKQLIEREPDEATNYNQLAWLWANTDRNLKEALSLSLKSLELKPNEAGYLDTLARCYFALGDFENAVASQKNAVALDPHSGQMNRQLKQFEDALAKSRATTDPS